MANLMDLLQSQISGSVMENLSDHLGVSDKQKTSVAANAAMSFLTNALAKNVSQEGGASALMSALDRDHDGSILDDIAGMVTGGGLGNQNNKKMLDGVGILGHILGNNQNSAIDAISKISGLDQNKTASLLVKLAPVVLGMLGKQKRQSNMSSNGIVDLLMQTATSQRQTNQRETSLIEKILDQNGDGSYMDEVASMGMKALGGFFRK